MREYEDSFVWLDEPGLGMSLNTSRTSMLAAYYSRGCDSRELFAEYEIAKDTQYAKHLNQYNVLFLNMQEFLSQSNSMKEMLQLLKKSLLWDLLEEYADLRFFDETNLTRTMQDIYSQTKISFILVIDEWDCIFREYKDISLYAI